MYVKKQQQKSKQKNTHTHTNNKKKTKNKKDKGMNKNKQKILYLTHGQQLFFLSLGGFVIAIVNGNVHLSYFVFSY